MTRRAVFPKCATCKLEHASDAGPVELGWQTFITRTSHLAWCLARPLHGRVIYSHCGKVWDADIEKARRYEPAVRTCQLCGKHVEKKNRESGERARAGVE